MKSRDVKIKIVESIFIGKVIKSWQSFDVIDINSIIRFLNDNLKSELDYDGNFSSQIQIRLNGWVYVVFQYEGDDDETYIHLVLDEEDVSFIYS